VSTGALAAAKLEVMAAVPYVQKQHGQGLGYTFAGEAAFIDKLHPAMVAAGLTIAPEGMELVHQEVYTTAKGSKMNRVVVRATYRLTHAGSGESEILQTFGEGADSGDKSVNKAMTGAYKYALRQAFLIETGNDPDEVPSDQQQRATRGRPTTPAAPPPHAAKAPAPAKADPAEVGRKILAAATNAEELRAAWTTLTAHQKDVLAGLKDELKAKFAAPAAEPEPPADPPAGDRDGLLYELYSACEVLKTPAHQMLSRHRKQVGAFPDGKPLPKVEELDLPALKHLLQLVQQQADAAVEAQEREAAK
jgi:hypothetical protein